MRRSRVALLVTACLASATGVARADEKATCIEAHEHGQELRLASHWGEARKLFLLCAQPTCPALLVQDCIRWAGELAQEIPSVVVSAKQAGLDIDDVATFIDGSRFGSRLPAVPIPLDPGEHVLRFERTGFGPVEKRVILHDGEHDRRVEVSFEAPSSATKAEPSGAPLGAYAVTGLAAVAVGASVTFLVLGKVREHDLATSPCGQSGTCSDSQVNPIRIDYTVSGIAAGVAAVAVGIAVWQLVVHRSRATTAASSPLRLQF